MWESKTKRDLMIEVWEKLDCESIGSAELEAIEEVVRDVLGETAVDSPMKIARLLADEGAELRHSEIMELHVLRYEAKPYTAEFRNILKVDSFRQTLTSIRNLDNLRKKFLSEGDKNGIRLIRERVIEAKKKLTANAKQTEIAEWLTVWLQTPDAFETWISLRQRSTDFRSKFGDDTKPS
ncbi:MAG: hypothetical protein ABIR33_10460 [Pyrinomonadaceae bacterium]